MGVLPFPHRPEASRGALRIAIQEAADARARSYRSLGDDALGRAVLALCRESRRSLGVQIRSRGRDVPLERAMWDVLPELCRRLGARLAVGECGDPAVNAASNAALRPLVANAARAVFDEATLRRGERFQMPLDILGRHPSAGSPLADAMDRVAPPRPGDRDWFVLCRASDGSRVVALRSDDVAPGTPRP